MNQTDAHTTRFRPRQTGARLLLRFRQALPYLRRPWAGYLACVCFAGLSILVGWLETHFTYDIILSGALLVVNVVLIAWGWGFFPAIFMLFLDLLVIGSLYLPPTSNLAIAHNFENLLHLITFVLLAAFIAVLLRQREKAHHLASRNEREAREARRQLEEFVSVICHELKTPLTGIQGNIQLTQRQVKSLQALVDSMEPEHQILCKITHYLERARAQAHTQQRLINDLLDASRINTRRLTYAMGEYNLCEIARRVVEDLGQMYPQRVIHLNIPRECALPVYVDADRVGQVIHNYLSNAIKYAPADKPIEVLLSREDSATRLAVRDEGPGLPEEDQQRVWERFYRAKGIAANPQVGESQVNLGLGLYICASIIADHHGQVGVTSCRGRGTTFWFTLPLNATSSTPKIYGKGR